MSARTLALLAVVVAPSVSACDPAGPSEPTLPRAAAAEAAPASPARRGRLIAGERVVRVPRWPAPTEVAAEVRARLPRSAQAAVGRARVPVLAPADPDLVATTEVFDGPSGYALSAHRGELTLVIQASRFATLLAHVGHVPGNTRMRGVDGWVTVNDGIRSAAWVEHGIAYSLDLECFHADGPDCSEQALRAAVEDLVYVGGVGEVAAAGQGGTR